LSNKLIKYVYTNNLCYCVHIIFITFYYRYTMKKDTSSVAVYAILLEWPADNMVKLGAPITSAGTTVIMLGYKKPFTWTAGAGGKGINILIPPMSWDTQPCEWAWTLKITGLQN
jgi:hypothetical protein